MNTGERLKVPSPDSDGWATDHFNPDATRAHMDHVIARLRETLGDLRSSGLSNLYLASYEVVGQLWSPGFIAEFQCLRGYDMTPWLPAIFGATIGHHTTARFLFDYRKTLSDVLIGAYYRAARDAANETGLGIKSEASGPGPPIHNVPVCSGAAHPDRDRARGAAADRADASQRAPSLPPHGKLSGSVRGSRRRGVLTTKRQIPSPCR